MFILKPDPYLMPSYRISPFTTVDISLNHNLPDNDCINDYFSERFSGKKYNYTLNGREAINLALSHYHLQKDDVVTIITTSGNFYISGCVTSEIEKYCKWSRIIGPGTKLILVNHEFGYPYADLLNLKKTGIPIIEDCAHSFFSNDKKNTIGTLGDFAIYSFPKMFPLQIGGLLVNNMDCKPRNSKHLDKKQKQYIKNVLSYYIKRKEEIIEKHLANYAYLSTVFKTIGLPERFTPATGTVPGVFIFRKGKHQFDLTELKKHFYAQGIQCSVFYGEESFFIPVHQALHKSDLDYFLEVMKSFIKNSMI